MAAGSRDTLIERLSEVLLRWLYSLAVEKHIGRTQWKRFCRRVADFCRAAGTSNLTENPVENIDKLRVQLTFLVGHSREAALELKIDQLKETVRMQQRIITSQTYRHVLESIPDPEALDPKGKKITGSSAK